LSGGGSRGDDDQVGVLTVRDERLRARDDVAVSVENRPGRYPRQVASGAWLGHRDRADQGPRGKPRQPAALLCVIGQIEQVGPDDVVLESQ